MHTLSLDGKWEFRKAGDAEWLSATVPGCNFTDLLAHNRIPDPFVADNELKVQWVAEADWEYRRTFMVNAELLACAHVSLECGGLDTLATVFINGRRAGAADNMFRPWRFPVKRLLKEGANEVLVRFRSPTRHGRKRLGTEPTHQVNDSLPGAPFVRKAQCQFGWDWGPKLAPSGVWRSLCLTGRTGARLTEVRLRQEHRSGAVSVLVECELERYGKTPLRLQVTIQHPGGMEQVAQGPLQPALTHWAARVAIADPQLWWPNGYGAQPLYTVVVEVQDGEGRVLDREARRIGLLTLELRRKKDAFGESFTFVVNGVPIFAKGANWIPADSFPNRVTPERYRHLLGSAAQAHMNMLRVWGGGFYEEDVFYDLCDELGILIWQDFTFACAIYPSNKEFLESFRQEAVANVRRLRHRACLALWCGNNEMEQGWAEWGWTKRFPVAVRRAYERLYHKLLPAWVAAEDDATPYWPSSPSSNRAFVKPNAEDRGDGHYWEVWFRFVPFTEYRKHYFRFQSEFGFQSLPPFDTVKAFAEPADWNLTSRILEHHQRHGGGNGKILYFLSENFRVPKDFPSLCYVSQILQAEAIRYGVEHWRRNRHRVSGTLYWQLNDCWPVCSWSSLDYFGRWKALHYAARRFYRPVLLSAEEQGTRIALHLTNDTREAFRGRVAWRLEALDGEGLRSGEMAVQAKPGANVLLKKLDFAREVTERNRRHVIFVYELEGPEGDLLSSGVVTFVPSKHLELADPGLHAELAESGNEWRVKLRAEHLARFVEVSFEGRDTVFTDNFFDVPGEGEYVVTCPKLLGQTVEQMRARLSVKSLWDSYQGPGLWDRRRRQRNTDP